MFIVVSGITEIFNMMLLWTQEFAALKICKVLLVEPKRLPSFLPPLF